MRRRYEHVHHQQRLLQQEADIPDDAVTCPWCDGEMGGRDPDDGQPWTCRMCDGRGWFDPDELDAMDEDAERAGRPLAGMRENPARRPNLARRPMIPQKYKTSFDGRILASQLYQTDQDDLAAEIYGAKSQAEQLGGMSHEAWRGFLHMYEELWETD